VAESVEPATVIETDRLDNEAITLPLADRIPHPGRIGIIGQRAPIGVDLPRRGANFRQNQGLLERLDQLEAQNEHIRRQAGWETLGMRILKRGSLVALVCGDSFGPQGLLFRFQSPKDVQHVFGEVLRIDLQADKVVAEHARQFSFGSTFGLPYSGKV
jgi:hypothetical protein